MMKGKNRENVSNSSMVMTGMVVLLVSLAFMLLATPAAAQPVEVWVNAPEYVAEGATFEVTIDVDDLTNFNCGMFDLSFDSNVVVVTDVEEGRLDEKIIPAGLWKFMDKNTIRVFLEISGVSVVSGSGYLAKISFQAVGEEGDESVLDLSKGELICFNLVEEIPAWWIAAEVRIVKGEPTPTPPADRVHNLNTSENFSFIQAAIDDPDTKEGHIIEVADGIYYENVKVTKCLTIRSENGSTNCIVLAAKANDNVFEITADYACIRGFTVKGALAKGKAGIYLNASHCCVSNNNCSDNHYGIRLEGAHNNSISNNGCYTNTWDGISLGYSSKNRISKNNCSHNHFGYDIHLNDSNNNNISNNICTANKWEGGFHLSYSNNNNISNNDCLYNKDDGIYLSYSNNNCISNNNCSNNDDGIYL
ncbi:MAG: right-handed parallel beta-helix repeat-containing protein, partial [Methanophagales archaeon]|nr:right-handed parallel beta-helix repeat-containing protein [Methanophagales archaeon]